MGIGAIILKFFPIDVLKNIKSIWIEANFLKIIVFLIITSIIDFVENVFIYTVYGNVLKEFKK
jgi:hypothetical protein